jgi:autotransporter-associated beta strand protein
MSSRNTMNLLGLGLAGAAGRRKAGSRACRWLAAILVAGGLALWTGTAQAQSGTWTLDGTGNWGDITNWSSGAGPIADGSGNTADFSTIDITADRTIHLDTARTIGNLTFGDTATGTAAGWILDNNATPANILTLAGTTPTITVNALAPVDIYAPKSVYITGVITGASGLTKAGAGRLKLTGVNTYTGGTVVDGGTLAIIKDNNMGTVPGAFRGREGEGRTKSSIRAEGASLHNC